MANNYNLKPFRKGFDSRRNTKGAPGGVREFKKFLREELRKKVILNGEKITLKEELFRNLVAQARKGKFWAHKMICDNAYGRSGKTNKDYSYDYPKTVEMEKDIRARGQKKKYIHTTSTVWNDSPKVSKSRAYDLRYGSTLAWLRRIHGLPPESPPPRSEEQQLRDMEAEVEKTRIMLGHPSDPNHYRVCDQCRHLLPHS